MSVSPDFDPLAIEETRHAIKNDVDDRNISLKAEWIQEDLAQVKIKVFRGHDDAIRTCSFCDSDQRALTASYDRTVKLWDLHEGVLLNTYQGHNIHVSQARPDKTGKRFVSCGWDKKVHFWDVESGQILWSQEHDGIVTCCDISSDGKMVASGSDLDHTLSLWDAHSGELIHEIKDLHTSTLMQCKFSPKNDRIFTCSMDKSTKFWDIKSQRQTISIQGHFNIISDVSLSPDEHTLASVSWDKSIGLWDIATGAYRLNGPERIGKAHEGSISSCEFSKDGMLLVTGGYDQQVCIWDIKNKCQRMRLQGHTDWVEDVSISEDQKWILSVSKDKSMRLWNVERTDNIRMVLQKQRAIGLRIFNE